MNNRKTTTQSCKNMIISKVTNANQEYSNELFLTTVFVTIAILDVLKVDPGHI